MPTSRVLIYSKTNCSLCEEALAVVQTVQAELPFELSIVDITTLPHEQLLRYRYDIPVVVVNGVEAFKHRVNAEELKRLLRGTSVAE